MKEIKNTRQYYAIGEETITTRIVKPTKEDNSKIDTLLYQRYSWKYSNAVAAVDRPSPISCL